MSLCQELDDPRGIAWSLDVFAGLLAAGGHADGAARLWGASDGLLESVRGSLVPPSGWIRDRYFEPVKTSLGSDHSRRPAPRDARCRSCRRLRSRVSRRFCSARQSVRRLRSCRAGADCRAFPRRRTGAARRLAPMSRRDRHDRATTHYVQCKTLGFGWARRARCLCTPNDGRPSDSWARFQAVVRVPPASTSRHPAGSESGSASSTSGVRCRWRRCR